MKSILVQKRENGDFRPFTEKDKDVADGYKKFQVVEFRPVKKNIPYRSLEQLRLYWALCTTISEHMIDDSSWNTKDKVDLQCKIQLRFYDPDKTIHVLQKDGSTKINFTPFSIAFENLNHIQACFYFDRAFDFMAEVMNISLGELFNLQPPI